MTTQRRPLKVFLCHDSNDKVKVRELYRYLRRRSIKPWFDEVDLVGGQDWQAESQRALAASDAVIICLTKSSVAREGYLQRQVKFALDKALEMPEGRIFLIPVRFEECEIPFMLSRYKCVDLFDQGGYQSLMMALQARARDINVSEIQVEAETPSRNDEPIAPIPSPEPPEPIDEPKNPLPTWVVLLLNLVITVVASFLLGNRAQAPCVSVPLISALSVVLIGLMVFHIIWRFAYPDMSRNPEGIMEFPLIKVPLAVLIRLVNSIHPWKVGTVLLLIVSLIILVAAAFLNLHPTSPFYAQSQPFTIQGFSVQRSVSPAREQLAPGNALTMIAGESVLVEVVLLGEAQVSCTWSILTKPNTEETGCSIDYSALTPGVDDILSVFVQPACGLNNKSASLFIDVQQ
jgi:hypothetical protein